MKLKQTAHPSETDNTLAVNSQFFDNVYLTSTSSYVALTEYGEKREVIVFLSTFEAMYNQTRATCAKFSIVFNIFC